MADQPWHELPATIADVLRPQLDDVAGEMMEAVATVPAYARPLEGPFGDGIRAGVQEALRHFLDEIEAGGTVERSDVYRALGRGEMRCRPQPRVAAERLSDRRPGRLAAVRRGRGRRRPRARHAVPAGRVDVCLHRRAVGRIGRGARAGAVGGRQRGAVAPPAAGADARARAAGRSRRGPGRGGGRRLAAAADDRRRRDQRRAPRRWRRPTCRPARSARRSGS